MLRSKPREHMALVSMPKQRVDSYRSAIAASPIETILDPDVRRAMELAKEDAGRAMLQLLAPHLKGNVLMLHMKYGYGSIDLIDDDGFYRMDIPDEYLAATLPREFGGTGKGSLWSRLFGRK